MKTGRLMIFGIACLLASVGYAHARGMLERNLLTGDIPDVVEFDYKPESRVWWARVAQCQLRYTLEKRREDGLYRIPPGEERSLERKVLQALDSSIRDQANIVIFPELVLAVSDATRVRILETLAQKARQYDTIIICGSYYDAERRNRSIIITPDGVVHGDKIRPSRIETNPLNGYGMKSGEKVAYLRTKYGNFIVVTCVDLISDDVQYIVRRMSNLGILDLCININYNPASWEFMREASAVVKRHPLFFTITNNDNPGGSVTDDGFSYGNTSVFASIHKENTEYLVPDQASPFSLCQSSGGPDGKKCRRHPAYETLIAHIPPGKEGVLLYDLNLRMVRTPAETNAPDQGYPTIRNVRTIPIADFK